jgi:hypothetical protein
MTPVCPIAGHRPAPQRRVFAVLRGGLPSLRLAFTGSVIWGGMMAASALVAVWAGGWASPDGFRGVALLFGAGGALAFAPALTLANLLSWRRSPEAAFAAAFVCLTGATVAATGSLLGLHIRLSFADTHTEPFGVAWIIHIVFALPAGLLQFAVLGLRLYFPFGLAALIAASLWHARYALRIPAPSVRTPPPGTFRQDPT